MSKRADTELPEPFVPPAEPQDPVLANLRAKAARLETASTDSRRGRWPANDYY